MQFKNLKFQSYFGGLGLRAVHFFKNGYGVSVIRIKTDYDSSNEYYTYTNNENEWEVAILVGNIAENEICYDLEEEEYKNGIIGYCNEEKVNEILSYIESLPKYESKEKLRRKLRKIINEKLKEIENEQKEF